MALAEALLRAAESAPDPRPLIAAARALLAQAQQGREDGAGEPGEGAEGVG